MKQRTFWNVAMLKRMIPVILLAVCAQLTVQAAPDEALLRLFNRTFPQAEYVTWTEEGEYDIVSFIQNENNYRIWYDRGGSIVYSLRYFGEAELPLSVLSAVKKKHRDRRIEGVTEITDKEGVSYEFVLSDDKKFYIVGCTSGGAVSMKHSIRKQQ